MNSIPSIFKSGFFLILTLIAGALTGGCTAGKASDKSADSTDITPADHSALIFTADSAYSFLKTQVDFGPRVPNTAAHRAAGGWLERKLGEYCDTVIAIPFRPVTFDGVTLDAKNIFAQINPSAESRLLLLAHWDSRPWADKDPDPAMRSHPVDGANDGASGVAVILELARVLKSSEYQGGVDILFVDAEDWGSEGDDDTWALGAQHFAQNPPLPAYSPKEAILLDMVGGKNALFTREYFSQQSHPALNQKIWSTAKELGYGDMFIDRVETAVTDDHVRLIEAGIPAVDIIEFHPGQGFNPTWHTTADNIDNIDPGTLKAVGDIVLQVITGQ